MKLDRGRSRGIIDYKDPVDLKIVFCSHHDQCITRKLKLHNTVKVFACSLITNKCGEETNHDEVQGGLYPYSTKQTKQVKQAG